MRVPFLRVDTEWGFGLAEAVMEEGVKYADFAPFGTLSIIVTKSETFVFWRGRIPGFLEG